MALNKPDRNSQVGKRLNQLPRGYRSTMLQLLNKCEYIYSKEVLKQHAKNASNLIDTIGVADCNRNSKTESKLKNQTTSNYLRLPSTKKKYMFINKKSGVKLTLKQLSEKVGKSNKTIYSWIYSKNAKLYKKYDVVREIIEK